MCVYMHVHVYMYMQMHLVLTFSNISRLSKPFPNRSRMLPPLLPTPSHLPFHPPPSLPLAHPLCHPITREIHATCIYIYMGVQLLSSEKTGKEPCSQFTQTYSLFVTFVADLVHSLRRRTVWLRHLLQTQFTVSADVHSFLRVYIFRRPSSQFLQTCSLFMIFVADQT